MDISLDDSGECEYLGGTGWVVSRGTVGTMMSSGFVEGAARPATEDCSTSGLKDAVWE